jgi:hypothetical protein
MRQTGKQANRQTGRQTACVSMHQALAIIPILRTRRVGIAQAIEDSHPGVQSLPDTAMGVVPPSHALQLLFITVILHIGTSNFPHRLAAGIVAPVSSTLPKDGFTR